jgi:hypothetical protein
MKKLGWFALSAALVASTGAVQRTEKPAADKAQTAQAITVWRTATCGCCAKWVDHLKAAGFTPTVHIVQSTDESPAARGVPASLRSCHSASLEGYNVEGHVPADVIKQLLRDRPKVAGIAVPGMPAGSPGMESPNPVAFDVVAYDAKGNTSVFATRGPQRR